MDQEQPEFFVVCGFGALLQALGLFFGQLLVVPQDGNQPPAFVPALPVDQFAVQERQTGQFIRPLNGQGSAFLGDVDQVQQFGDAEIA